MSIHAKDGGTWKEATGLHVKDAGTWKEVQEGYVKDAGVWKKFFDLADLSGGPLAAYVVPGLYIVGDLPVDHSTTVSFEAMPSGGTAPYTYAWSLDTSDISISGSATGKSVLVAASNSGTPTTKAGTLTCVVTDSASASVTVNVSISFGFGEEIS